MYPVLLEIGPIQISSFGAMIVVAFLVTNYQFGCEYPLDLYDCNGDCIFDTDEDGVCDQLEVLGCMDLFNNKRASDPCVLKEYLRGIIY